MSNLSTGQVGELIALDKTQKGGIGHHVQRFIRELTRKPGEAPPCVFDTDGFETSTLDYSPDLATIKAESEIDWDGHITDEHFKRRPFEQGVGEVQIKQYFQSRLAWSLEVNHELEDMGCSGATIREGVDWALKHDPKKFGGCVIALLGSVWQRSGDCLCIALLVVQDGQWCLEYRWGDFDRWHEATLFLAVRRKPQSPQS